MRMKTRSGDESLDGASELVGSQFGVAFPVAVAYVMPVALEITPRMLTAAPGCSSYARPSEGQRALGIAAAWVRAKLAPRAAVAAGPADEMGLG